MRRVIVPGDEEETIAFAVEHFLHCGHEAILHHGAFFVALSGGSTPKKIYQRLTKRPFDWEHVYVFWSDERAVPATHPDSNYRMAMDAGFSHVPAHFFRMKGEGDIQSHALEYETLIKTTLKRQPFDLIMLGVGEDGHTASLFPGTDALKERARLVVANEVPQKQTWRMTFTYPLINAARHTVFYAMGQGKRAILQEVFQHQHYPASSVLPSTWILDLAANHATLHT